MWDMITEVDGQILLWIQENLRCAFLTPIMKFITHLGDAGIFWIVLTIGLLIFKKTRKVGLMSALALLGALLIDNIILKNLVARVRPYEVVDGLNRIIDAQIDFSFPSGHTGSSFASGVVCFKELPKQYGIPLLVLAFLIAFSRLYVGVHYPTDVLAGMVIGTIVALLACKVVHSVKPAA
ncbi:MAG: phosphatase PAP2 family protein [Roseburia sp.]